MQVASIEDRGAPKGPDCNSSSRARARSNRTGCGSAIGFIGWSGTKTCRPNLTSIPPGRAGVDGSRQQRVGRYPFVQIAQGCPEPRAGAQARLHMIAHSRGLDGGSVAPFDAADPGCSRSRASFLAVPSGRFLPTTTAGDRHAIGSRPPVFPWVRLPEGNTQPTQPIRSAGCQRAGMRSGGLLPPPAPRSRTSAAVDHLGRVDIRLSSYRRLTSR